MTNRKHHLPIFAAVIGLSLAGCGGDGGDFDVSVTVTSSNVPASERSYVQNLLQKGFDHVAECCRGHGWRVDIRYRSAGHAQPPSGGLLHQLAFVLRQ